MIVTAIKTRKVVPGATSIIQILDEAIQTVKERSVLVITSKVVSICENSVLPIEGTDRDELLKKESELFFVDKRRGEHRYNFTIKQHTLIPASGVDVSNGNGYYILWPKNPISTATSIRSYLMEKYKLISLGVIITDSTIGLSRWGTLGIAIGHSGFEPVKDYIGKPDLFGRPLTLSKANVAGGLAAAAVLAMGEGAEQTPLAVIEDVKNIEFWKGKAVKRDPGTYYISPLNDEPFQPFFTKVEWQKGGKFND